MKRINDTREKKILKLRSLLNETSKSLASSLTSSSATVDLVNFGAQLPLIIDPSVRSIGIRVEKTTMFASNLMPCKFVFRTLESANRVHSEYSTIYKVGDDLRQDQLIVQMIALMDKVNIQLK
jgi:phosphatidylinositol 3-kinase